ncbi:NACHT domain-containing protein, partial [Nonomuraea endophytica]|uniref:NACHT domain-containing protein n=1 Tax=Nonomuraea endophytica TaxID=714136 RepID=UPI00161F34AF
MEEREQELAELAAFCTADQGSGYVWWQGRAWSGKSALMATLVLDPPPGVRVVSFFITARYAGQSDRQAFLDVVLPQLAELLGQSLPPLLGVSTQQGWFNQLLEEAAQACTQAGERLILVVDGLDEDRGVTVGPGAHSIAALLPSVVVEGLRIVVSGRPRPPVPTDVPARHPLRDWRIVRHLTPSRKAQVIRDDAMRELAHVLHGEPVGCNILGLLVAAGGGLTVGDLAELTEISPGEVREWLCAVLGRTFTSRNSHWQPEVRPEVFVLAHEELQVSARESFGESGLAGFRERIHAWAQGYQEQGWPEGTPQYLLRGYHRLLREADDLKRMVACATDRRRLDRMLDVSGGDSEALTEIMACQSTICGQAVPDLSAMLRLAYTREQLADRNANIPFDLPVVWARLGNSIRAEALARSITDPDSQAQALMALGEALVGAGEFDHAETLARSITGPDSQAWALAALVKALVGAGEFDHARRIAHTAETVACSITGLGSQARALAALVKALVGAGEFDHARRIAHTAETLARSITDPDSQAQALMALGEALVGAGEFDHAETLARSITSPDSQARA